MAKKAKRQVRKVSVGTEMGAATAAGPRAFDRDFAPDYTHVRSDLRRIGILAGSFFAILVVLSFFLH